ncbi:MAG: ribbon-helix-helix protein, CopG family [Dehalococcoidales bacterium]|nr:ribbon-helix-helix protein, CopG family [Dehalococcoidales bacterium]
MDKEKIAITLDKKDVGELDRLVNKHVFQSRSQAIQEAVSEKLQRMKRTRLAEECAKLEPSSEKKLAEEGIAEDMKEWPEY